MAAGFLWGNPGQSRDEAVSSEGVAAIRSRWLCVLTGWWCVARAGPPSSGVRDSRTRAVLGRIAMSFTCSRAGPHPSPPAISKCDTSSDRVWKISDARGVHLPRRLPVDAACGPVAKLLAPPRDFRGQVQTPSREQSKALERGSGHRPTKWDVTDGARGISRVRAPTALCRGHAGAGDDCAVFAIGVGGTRCCAGGQT